jgi:hypothetical protein
MNQIAPSLHSDGCLHHWFGSIGFEAIKAVISARRDGTGKRSQKDFGSY